ncbi:uncharacterized protein PHA67_020574 [Liasis olivaceus]
MEEQELVLPKEEEGSERRGRDPLIVQVRTIGDFLSGDGPSHFKMESEEETHRRWDSEWQEFLKSVSWLSPAPSPPPSEEDAKDFQVPLGRVKEEPQEESCGEARGEAVLPRDPNISGNTWMDREKLDFCMKFQVRKSLEDAIVKPPRLEEEPLETVIVHLPWEIKQESDGEANSLECEGQVLKHEEKTFQLERSEEIDTGKSPLKEVERSFFRGPGIEERSGRPQGPEWHSGRRGNQIFLYEDGDQNLYETSFDSGKKTRTNSSQRWYSAILTYR